MNQEQIEKGLNTKSDAKDKLEDADNDSDNSAKTWSGKPDNWH